MTQKRPTHTGTTAHASQDAITVDLHGMGRWKARKVLFNNLIKLLAEGRKELLVIHGYHHGTVLRDYIRSGSLSEDAKRHYPLLPEITTRNFQNGATKISFSGRKMSWVM